VIWEEKYVEGATVFSRFTGLALGSFYLGYDMCSLYICDFCELNMFDRLVLF
jgi:hypothetical protein